MRRTTPDAAFADPTRHSLRPTGFFEHDEREAMRPGFAGLPPVLPDLMPAIDDSLHELLPPNGNPPLAFRWLATPHAWAPYGARQGHRMAFAPEYLGSHGWRYGRPITAQSAAFTAGDSGVAIEEFAS